MCVCSGDVDAGVTCSKQPKKNSKKKRGGNDNTTDDFTANCLVYMVRTYVHT